MIKQGRINERTESIDELLKINVLKSSLVVEFLECLEIWIDSFANICWVTYVIAKIEVTEEFQYVLIDLINRTEYNG